MAQQTETRRRDETEHLTNGQTTPRYMSLHPIKRTDFDELYHYEKPRKPGLLNRVTKQMTCDPKEKVFAFFPILKWLPEYRWKKDLVSDIISGFTVAIMHIPQGMAYAMLGGVPPVVGIYMAFFPVLIYFLMGTSRHISMGTFAVVCMMTSKSVILYSTNAVPFNSSVLMENSTQLIGEEINNASTIFSPIQVATIVCFVVGVWQLILGLCHLGVLSVLLSETLVSGFTTGAAVHVLTSQLKNLLGIKVASYSGPLKLIYIYIDIFQNIHKANVTALIISAIAIFTLAVCNEWIKPYVMRRFSIPVPSEFLAIVIGTLASMYGHLEETYKIQVVGEIPTGLPVPAAPPINLLLDVIVDGLIIAIVAFSVNMSMASIFARKHDYTVDANQELIASGCSNIFGSFFSCIPFAASLSRSLIQESVGGKTQLASIVSCVLLLLVLLVIGPFFEPLPNSVLASIVIVALKGMFLQIKDLPAAYKLSYCDGCVWLVTFLSVVLLDIDYGLGIGVAFSLFCIIIMGQKPSVTELAHIEGTELYLDSKRYHALSNLAKPCEHVEHFSSLCLQKIGLPESNTDSESFFSNYNYKDGLGESIETCIMLRFRDTTEVPGIIIIQISGGLHFANKEYVRHKIYKFLDTAPTLSDKKSTSVATLGNNQVLDDIKDYSKCNEEQTYLTVNQNQIRSVVLDMMPVSFIDPSAVRMILSVYTDLKKKGILLCLAGSSAPVYEKLIHCDFFSDFPQTNMLSAVHHAVKFSQQECRNTET